MRGSHQFKIGPVKMKGFVFKDVMTGMQERGYCGIEIMNNIAFEWSKLPIKELIFFVVYHAAEITSQSVGKSWYQETGYRTHYPDYPWVSLQSMDNN